MVQFDEEDQSPTPAALFATKQEQAAVERTRTIAWNMHVKQIPTEVIAEFIGVPFKDIQKIIEQNLR